MWAQTILVQTSCKIGGDRMGEHPRALSLYIPGVFVRVCTRELYWRSQINEHKHFWSAPAIKLEVSLKLWSASTHSPHIPGLCERAWELGIRPRGAVGVPWVRPSNCPPYWGIRHKVISHMVILYSHKAISHAAIWVITGECNIVVSKTVIDSSEQGGPVGLAKQNLKSFRKFEFLQITRLVLWCNTLAHFKI